MIGTVFSMFFLNALAKIGFSLDAQIQLWEFEFKGIKPYKNMKASKFYPNGVPEIFLVCMHYGTQPKL